MSNYNITNNTNSTTNTLANTLAPGASSVTGYNQGGASITSTLLSNSSIESTTTGYKSSDTDIGSSFCAKYMTFAGGTSYSIPFSSNYSKCSIVMCGGGGGGGGGGVSPTISQQSGGAGGDGGITILQNLQIAGAGVLYLTVGQGGLPGAGETKFINLPRQPAQPGGPGTATIVSFTSANYIPIPGAGCTANGGSGGQGGQVSPASPGTAGNIVPTTQNFTTATLNGAVTYQSTPDRVIKVSTTNYGQGGVGGTGSPVIANAGRTGNDGYLRIYFYP